jgi:hypothetical protein
MASQQASRAARPRTQPGAPHSAEDPPTSCPGAYTRGRAVRPRNRTCHIDERTASYVALSPVHRSARVVRSQRLSLWAPRATTWSDMESGKEFRGQDDAPSFSRAECAERPQVLFPGNGAVKRGADAPARAGRSSVGVARCDGYVWLWLGRVQLRSVGTPRSSFNAVT